MQQNQPIRIQWPNETNTKKSEMKMWYSSHDEIKLWMMSALEGITFQTEKNATILRQWIGTNKQQKNALFSQFETDFTVRWAEIYSTK